MIGRYFHAVHDYRRRLVDAHLDIELPDQWVFHAIGNIIGHAARLHQGLGVLPRILGKGDQLIHQNHAGTGGMNPVLQIVLFRVIDHQG